MRVQVAQWSPYGAAIAVAIVDSEHTLEIAGKAMINRIGKYFPAQAVMLVSVEANGFRAFAYFQTHQYLALMQLEILTFDEVDLSVPPVDDSELPF